MEEADTAGDIEPWGDVPGQLAEPGDLLVVFGAVIEEGLVAGDEAGDRAGLGVIGLGEAGRDVLRHR